jgi:hypothetical protein
MTYELYKLVHLSGLILLFLGLGATLTAGRAPSAPGRKIGLGLHGLGLLALLVAGFGMHARLYENVPPDVTRWPLWFFGKLGAWVLIAVLPVLVKRGVVPVALGWLLAIALGVAAAWLVLEKPV